MVRAALGVLLALCGCDSAAPTARAGGSACGGGKCDEADDADKVDGRDPDRPGAKLGRQLDACLQLLDDEELDDAQDCLEEVDDEVLDRGDDDDFVDDPPLHDACVLLGDVGGDDAQQECELRSLWAVLEIRLHAVDLGGGTVGRLPTDAARQHFVACFGNHPGAGDDPDEADEVLDCAEEKNDGSIKDAVEPLGQYLHDADDLGLNDALGKAADLLDHAIADRRRQDEDACDDLADDEIVAVLCRIELEGLAASALDGLND